MSKENETKDYGWITNDPEIATDLKSVDMQYEKAVKEVAAFPLAEKVAAYRAAKLNRAAGYEKILNLCGIRVVRGQ